MCGSLPARLYSLPLCGGVAEGVGVWVGVWVGVGGCMCVCVVGLYAHVAHTHPSAPCQKHLLM